MADQETSWTRGYRTDSEYTFGVYPFLNPDNLLLTVALQGIRPVADIVSSGAKDGRALVYCELGCGQGMTLNLMAARDPGGDYYGIDYNPDQIRNAQSFASAAEISNATFSEVSFADLDEYDIPDCDVIVMHGIWSWIDVTMQDHIIRFIQRKLKPGGVVFSSYNCAVGRSADMPMRRLFLAAERASRQQARTPRLREMLEFTTSCAEAGAEYFEAHPASLKRLMKLADLEPDYIEHEYLNSSWTNYFHDEVAATMLTAQLEFAGSCDMVNNRLELALPSEAIELAGRMSCPSDVELLKDIWINNTFRRDIFVRDRQVLQPKDLCKLLNKLYFAICKPRKACMLDFEVSGGSVRLPDVPYRAILDALADGPMTGAGIATIAAGSAASITLDEIISTLVAAGYITLAPNACAASRIAASTLKFEQTMFDLVAARHNRFVAVIPGLGRSVQLSAISYFFWMARRHNVEHRLTWVYDQLTASGRHVMHEGKQISDKNMALELLKILEIAFNNEILPLMSLGHKA